MTNEKQTLVIAIGSCDGNEEYFENWMNATYPEIETRIENTLDGGLFDSDGERVEHENYWDQFCNTFD